MVSFDLIQARALARDGTGREERCRAQLSLRELADLVGVDPATLSRWERGEAVPRRPGALRWYRTICEITDELARRAPGEATQ